MAKVIHYDLASGRIRAVAEVADAAEAAAQQPLAGCGVLREDGADAAMIRTHRVDPGRRVLEPLPAAGGGA